MKRLIGTALAIMLAASGPAIAQGKGTVVTVGADASIWDSNMPPIDFNEIFSIQGAGQLNGEFVIVERDGIQIGLRATDRTDGLLTASGKRKGVYNAATGFDPGTVDRAEWNYDWHIDLRGTGTVLGDYKLTLTQTFAPKLNGSAGPLDLSFPDIFPGLLDNAVLYQSSQNPVFFNNTFDPNAEGTYNLMMKLQPKGGGAPLIAQIRVVVRDSN